MIREMLERSGIKTGLIGTIEIIDGSQKIHADNTTPVSYTHLDVYKRQVRS